MNVRWRFWRFNDNEHPFGIMRVGEIESFVLDFSFVFRLCTRLVLRPFTLEGIIET